MPAGRAKRALPAPHAGALRGARSLCRALLALAATLPVGCSCRDCGSGPPPVPFKEDGSAGSAESAGDEEVDLGVDGGSTAAASFAVVQAVAPRARSRQVDAGGTIVVAGGDEILLWLAGAATADGARVIVVLAKRAAGEVYLASATAGAGQARTEVRAVARATFAPTPGCGLTTSLRQIGEALVVASLEESCTAADAGIASHAPEWWIARPGSDARLLERLVVAAAASPAEPTLRLAPEPVDADADGRGDVALAISATVGNATASARLVFVDRPAGLAREPHQPEESVATAAGTARRRVRRQPESALASATAALALHHALCRESGVARVVLSGQEGVACGRSRGAATAAAVRAAALARLGRIGEAVDAATELDADWSRPSDATRAIALDALAAAPGVDGGAWLVQGPLHPAADTFGLRTRLPLLAFPDAEHVELRGPVGSRYSLVDGSLGDLPPTPPIALAITDSSGARAVASVYRTCAGTIIGLAPATSVAGADAPRNAPGPLLEARSAPGSAACNGPLPAALASDDHGWRVIGWAPSGLVAARGGRVRVVPVTVDGRPGGPPYDIDPATPLPAPLPAGAARADGSALAYVTPAGVVVQRFGAGASTRLLRPSGWSASMAQHASDVALAPDASRVAWITAGRVMIVGTGARPGPMATVEPAPGAPSAPAPSAP